MTCRVPPFALSVLAEATRISPNRRKSSDGACADAAHYRTGGDHVPSGPMHYTHAVDISHSVPGAPFWESRYGRFDAMAQARLIGSRMVAGTERRVKYLVANFGGPDMILDLEVSPGWRQNGSYKTDHRSHLHVSFTVAAELSTAPFFKAPEADMPLTATDIDKVADAVVKRLGRQPDGSSGVIGDEVKNVLGGYSPSGQYVDGLLVTAARKKYGLSKP